MSESPHSNLFYDITAYTAIQLMFNSENSPPVRGELSRIMLTGPCHSPLLAAGRIQYYYFLFTSAATTVGIPNNSMKPTADMWLNLSCFEYVANSSEYKELGDLRPSTIA